MIEKIVNDFKFKFFGDKCGYYFYDIVYYGWVVVCVNLNDFENVK